MLASVYAQLPDAGFFGSTRIQVEYSGKDQVQLLLIQPGMVTGTARAENVDGDSVGNIESFVGSGGFFESRDVLLTELPTGEPITVHFEGTFIPSAGDPPQPFALSTNGTLGPIEGVVARGKFPNDTLVWRGERTIADRVRINSGVTLQIEPGSVIRSAAPASSLTRGELQFNDGFLEAEGVIFENLDRITFTRSTEDFVPRASMIDCGFVSTQFKMDVISREYQLNLNNLFEFDILAYETKVVTTQAEIDAAEGAGVVFLFVDSNNLLSGRAFDPLGDEIFNVSGVSSSASDRNFIAGLASEDANDTPLPSEVRSALTRILFTRFGQSQNALLTEGTDFTFVNHLNLDFFQHSLPNSAIHINAALDGIYTVADCVLGSLRIDPSDEARDADGLENSDVPKRIAVLEVLGNEFSGLLPDGENFSQLAQLFSDGQINIGDNELWEANPDRTSTFDICLQNLAQGKDYFVFRNESVSKLKLGSDADQEAAFGVAAEANTCEEIILYGQDNLIGDNTVGRRREFRVGTGIQVGSRSADPGLISSNNNEITGNAVRGCLNGVQLNFAANNTLTRNVVEGNNANLVFDGVDNTHAPNSNQISDNAFRQTNSGDLNLALRGICELENCANALSSNSNSSPSPRISSQPLRSMSPSEQDTPNANIVDGPVFGGNFWSDNLSTVDSNEDGIDDLPFTAGTPNDGIPYVDPAPLLREPIIVNNTGDQGDADLADGVADSDLTSPGLQTTLRAALETANQLVGKDIIVFDQDVFTDPQTPQIGSDMEVTDIVVIDGNRQGEVTTYEIGDSTITFQSGAAGSEVRFLRLVSTSEEETEFIVNSDVVGLAIKDCEFQSGNFPGGSHTVLAADGGGSFRVTGCKFEGSPVPQIAVSIENSSGNQVGSSSPNDSNEFKQSVIEISGNSSTNNTIQGNAFRFRSLPDEESTQRPLILVDNAPNNSIGGDDRKAGNRFFDNPVNNTIGFVQGNDGIVIRGTNASNTSIRSNTFKPEGKFSVNRAVHVINAPEIVVHDCQFFFASVSFEGAQSRDSSVTGCEFRANAAGSREFDEFEFITIDGANDIKVGGDIPFSENRFLNELNPTCISVRSGDKNTIIGNRYGISLTPIKLQDSANDEIQSPEVVTILRDGSDELLGRVSGGPSQTFSLQFYQNPDKSPTESVVTTDGDGKAAFALELTESILDFPPFLIVTDEEGNTSEASLPVLPLYVTSASDEAGTSGRANADSLTASSTGTPEERSLRSAIQAVNRAGDFATDSEVDVRVFFRIGPDRNAPPSIMTSSPYERIIHNVVIGATLPNSVVDEFVAIGIDRERLLVDERATIQGTGTYSGLALFALDTSEFSEITFQNITIEDLTEAAIFASDSLNLVDVSSSQARIIIQGCEFRDLGGSGVFVLAAILVLGGSTDIPGEHPGNVFENCGRGGGLSAGELTRAVSVSTPIFALETLIQGNRFGPPNSDLPAPAKGNKNGLFVDVINEAVFRISDNVINSSDELAMNILGINAKDVIVERNILTDNGVGINLSSGRG
ncbi:MAG: NosD domain-containing protein, partial [Verrucomicrobiota bacterium]